MTENVPAHMRPERSFQGLILTLQRFWADYGCVILQPYDMEVGAGTFHTATFLRALGPEPWMCMKSYQRPSTSAYAAVIVHPSAVGSPPKARVTRAAPA